MNEANFDFIRELVRRRTGNVGLVERRPTVTARLGALALGLGFRDTDSMLDALRSTGGRSLEDDVVGEVLNGSTFFFRDVRLFELLHLEILPRLVDRCRSTKRLRIWSGACSRGQEVYSLLMMLAERFPETQSWDVQLLATDFAKTRLDYAAAGRFSQFQVNRGLPARYLLRYFEQQGDDWVVSPELMSRAEFQELNLVREWPAMPQMDLILLRYVLIYFDDATKRRLVSRAAERLVPGGYLVLGGSETAQGFPQLHRASDRVGGCYRRVCTEVAAAV